MTRSPRLLDADFHEAAVLPPVAYGLTDKLTPLSMASLTLPCDAPEVPVRSFVELFTSDGSAGIFRVTNLRTTPGEVRELTLQHGLCTLSDHMHRGESTQTGSLRTLLTKLLSNQTDWALGTVDVPDDEDLTWEYSNTNALQGLLSIMQELPGYYLDFDQTTRPWLLHVRARSTEVECEARFDRNVTQAQIEYDTTDMCTLAYADGLDAPIEADTAGTWGLIERHVSADEALGQDVITATVQRYLEQRKQPKLTITLTAMELSQLTGEPFDSFRKGQLCRCILPDMTAVQRIEAIERPDPIGEPEHVVLTLASTQDDLSVTVAGMVVDIRHVNQLYQQLDKNLRIKAETIDMLAAEMLLKATKVEVDIVSDRISVAEILLNETIGQLELKVDYNDYQSDIQEVSLRLDAAEGTLTAQAEEIYLKADKTYVDNLYAQTVKTSELETEILTVVDSARVLGYISGNDIDVQSLVAASVNSSYGSFDSITTDDLSIGGSAAATQAWVQSQGYLTEIPTGTADGFVTGNDVRGYCEALYATKTELSDYVLASSITKVSKYVVTKVTPTVNTSGNVSNVTYSGEYISFYT